MRFILNKKVDVFRFECKATLLAEVFVVKFFLTFIAIYNACHKHAKC